MCHQIEDFLNLTFFFRKSKIDATVAFPHLSGMSNEEAKKEYEKLIGGIS